MRLGFLDAAITRARRLIRAVVTHPILIGDALATMVAASLMIRLLPFRWTMAAVGVMTGPGKPTDTDKIISRCRWATSAVSRVLPWRTKCYEQGLTMHWLARRRGVATVFHYGVASDAATLSAHVWISVAGRTVLGEDGGQHRCLLMRPVLARPPANSLKA